MNNKKNAIVTQKNKGAKKMNNKKEMSKAINSFILGNDFLTRYIVDNVSEIIYREKQYNANMIYDVIINDLDNCYNNSYIMDAINDEINIDEIVDEINKQYRHIFVMLAKECNN